MFSNFNVVTLHYVFLKFSWDSIVSNWESIVVLLKSNWNSIRNNGNKATFKTQRSRTIAKVALYLEIKEKNDS